MTIREYEVLGSPDVGIVLADGKAHYGGEIVELDDLEAGYRVKRGWLRPLSPPAPPAAAATEESQGDTDPSPAEPAAEPQDTTDASPAEPAAEPQDTTDAEPARGRRRGR